MKLAIAGCVVGIGCGDEETTVTIDREPGAAVTALAVPVGDGAWRALPSDATRFVADGAYLLAAACVTERSGLPSSYVYGQRGATTAEASSVELPCGAPEPPGAATYHDVALEMLEPGVVSLAGFTTSSSTGPWTAIGPLSEGTHAIAAYDATRIAIRRDLAITAPTTLPAISLAEGAAFERHAFTLRGEPTFDWISSVTIVDDEPWVVQGTSDTEVAAVPRDEAGEGALRPIVLRIQRQTTARSIFVDDLVDATPRELELLPALDGIVSKDADAATLRWTALPEYEELTVTASETYVGATVDIAIVVTSGWLANADHLAVDFEGLPGWNTDWAMIGPQATRFFLAIGDTPDDGVTRFSTWRTP